MPDSGAIRAGKAFVEIAADDLNFKAALDRTARTFKAWGATLTAAGTKMFALGSLIAAPLVLATKMFANMGDELAKAATRTGISVESLSKLKYAADQSGTSLEGLEGGLRKMSKLVAEAGAGSKEAAGKIEAMGINLDELLKASPEDKLATFAQVIKDTTDPTKKAAIAMEIFGKSGATLIPLLGEGAQGINDLYEQAEKLGLVMSTEDARAAEEFGDRMSDLWSVVKSVAFTVGGVLAPVVRGIALNLTEGAKALKEFVKEHRDLINIAAAVALGLIGVGGALIFAGKAMSLAGSAFRVVSTIMSGTVSVISTLIAAAVSPIGLFVIGVGAATYALLKFTSVGQEVAGYLSGVFGDVAGDATAAFEGIKDALAAGDWKLAAQIMWTAIKLEWTKGVNTVAKLWAELKFAVIETMAGMTEDLSTIWSYFTEFLSSGWDTAKYAAGKFLTWLADSFRSTVNHVADLLQNLFMTTGKKQLGLDLKQIDEREKSGYYSKDAGANKKLADQQRAAAHATFDDYDDKARSGRDAQKDADYHSRQKALDDAYAKSQADISTQGEAERRKIEAEREKARKDHEADLRKRIEAATDPAETNDLKNELNRTIAQAKAERAAREFHADKPGDAGGGFGDAAKAAASGTFNKTALFGLGGNGVLENIAKNTRDTADALKNRTPPGTESYR